MPIVMREAVDDGSKALKILRSHYASQGKPRIIALYTELTSLKMESGETVTGYIIRAEKTVTSLRNAKEVISDGLIIAMILKGLPESYKPFAIHTTQSSEELTFIQFKVNYEAMKRQKSSTLKLCQKSAAKVVRQNGATTTEAPHTMTRHAGEKQITKMMSNKSRMDKKTKRKNKHSYSRSVKNSSRTILKVTD